jgi:hypothetical protein
MNIKIEKIGDRWFVIVNSVAGEVREDVSAQIEGIINSHAFEVASMVKKIRDAEDDAKQRAIDGCITALEGFIDRD